MKRSAAILTIIVLSVALAGCGDKATTTTHNDTPAETSATTQTAAAPATDANNWTGEILETMNSGGYTYVLLDTGSEKIWAAAPATTAEVGQKVSIPKGMMMAGFASKTLDRTFDEIYFVDGIYAPGGSAAASGGMGEMPQDNNHAGVGGAKANNVVGDAEVEGVSKVAGGYTVAEIFAQKATLGGQTIKVRGRVVKFTARIMGTNWIHIQDGSQGDLTVTTDATVATGDLVLIEGPLSVNKDFGAGYKYDAIIEGAKVTVE